MKTIYATFERIENAKAAIGRGKKESWNQAHFMIIFPEIPPVEEDRFEFGAEHFLGPPDSADFYQWPALREHEIEGIGQVKMAISFKPEPGLNVRNQPTLMDKELIADGLKKNKITVLIEVEDEIVPKMETILASEGAGITIFGGKREEL